MDGALLQRVIGIREPVWQNKPLGAVADNYDNQRIPLNNVERANRKGEYPYCGANGIVDCLDAYIFDGQFVLLAEDGGHWGRNEQSAYIMRGKFWVNNHAHILKAKKDVTLNGFLCFVLNFLNIDPLIGGDARGKLTQAVMKQIPIPLPPLSEQQKIAAVLGTIQRAVELQESILANVRELKKSLMHRLFTHGLRGEQTGETDLGPVPQSWHVRRFSDYVTLQRGQDLRRQDFIDGEIPVVGATQIIGYHNTANVKAPGVTVVRSGSSAGFAQFVECDFWAHNVVLYVKDFHGNDPKYVSYHLNHVDLSRFRAGVAVPTLNRNVFASLTTGIPEFGEQQEIASILRTLDEKLAVHESKKTALQCLFKTTLNQLMTGAVRVRDLDIDTSEVG